MNRKCKIESVPVGANFKVGDSKTVYVKIPEMVLHLPTCGFVVNCLREVKADYPSEMKADFFIQGTEVEYWWPETR